MSYKKRDYFKRTKDAVFDACSASHVVKNAHLRQGREHLRGKALSRFE